MMDLTQRRPGPPDPSICCKHCDDMGDNGYCSHCGKLHAPVSVFPGCRICGDAAPIDPLMPAVLCDRCAALVAQEAVARSERDGAGFVTAHQNADES